MAFLYKIPLAWYLAIFTVTFFMFYKSVSAQSNIKNNKVEELISYTENYYGLNDVLYRGRKYVPSHLKAKGHPFFLSDEWEKGSVTIQDQVFENIELKYDLEIDKVILKVNLKIGTSEGIILDDNMIKTFRIGEHEFVNASGLLNGDDYKGYFEQINKGDIRLLAKHKVNYQIKSSLSNEGMEYVNLKPIYYLLKTSGFIRISSQKTFLNIFKPYQKNINKFMKDNQIRLKKSDHYKLRKLMEYCNSLLF